MLTYMLVILLAFNPYLFGTRNLGGGKSLILIVFLTTFFIPVVAVLLMKFMGMVDDFSLSNKQQRIGPYIITGIFYLWMFRTLLDHPNIPSAYKIFLLGSVIALFGAFVVNLFSKISMHTTGIGGLLGMLLISLFYFGYHRFMLDLPGLDATFLDARYLLMFAFFLAGAVGSSRLILKAHEPSEIYGGYFIGIIAQLLALVIFI